MSRIHAAFSRWRAGCPRSSWVPWFAACIVLGLVLHRAWIGDDSLITARMAANLLHGYGWRWNIDDRVQAFTHPLWALLLIAPMALGLGWYSALLSLALVTTSLAMAGLLVLAKGRAPLAVAVLATLAASRAFIDYSTSGLENPLCNLLLVSLVALSPIAETSARRVGWLTFTVALLALTRMDLVLFGLPVLACACWAALRAAPRKGAVAAAILAGASPFLLWELFSIIYYGFPAPNTAYAKLNTGIDSLTALQLGGEYFRFSWRNDPWTPVATVGLAICVLVWRKSSASVALALGALAYYPYILVIGGDFMGGRFLVAPLVLVAVLLVSPHTAMPVRFERAFVGAALVSSAAFWCWPVFRPPPAAHYGVLDERASYAETTALSEVWRTGTAGIENNWSRLGTRLRDEASHEPSAVAGPPRLYWHAYAVGMLGLYAGPNVHIIDHLALTDALLARIPAAYDPHVQPGHFERMGQWSAPSNVTLHCPLIYDVCRFWRDYEQTLRTGTCALNDPALCEYWKALHLVTSGELFSAERWAAIVALNSGRLDHLIDRQRYRLATLEYPGER